MSHVYYCQYFLFSHYRWTQHNYRVSMFGEEATTRFYLLHTKVSSSVSPQPKPYKSNNIGGAVIYNGPLIFQHENKSITKLRIDFSSYILGQKLYMCVSSSTAKLLIIDFYYTSFLIICWNQLTTTRLSVTIVCLYTHERVNFSTMYMKCVSALKLHTFDQTCFP